MSEQWTPPYIYAGLYLEEAQREALRGRPQENHHVLVYNGTMNEKRWKEECERGGMHRYGQCPYCKYFYD